MTQNKIDYIKSWPKCRICQTAMTDQKTGETVSESVYEGVRGICNVCLPKIQKKACFKLIMEGYI